MINITSTTCDGKIYFTFTQDISDFTLEIIDDAFEGVIYRNYYKKVTQGSGYYIALDTAFHSFLNAPKIHIIQNGNMLKTSPFSFPKDALKNFSLIGNTCVAWRTYEVFNSPYTSPTIGNLILDDEMYVRFCEHNSTYLNAPVTLGESKGNINYYKQNGTSRVVNPNTHISSDYPISHHLDLEIHWIHTRPRILEFKEANYQFTEQLDEKNDPNDVILKWVRRTNRANSLQKIFLWSSSEMYNAHGEWERKQLINRFKSLPDRSIFLTERPEEEFEDDLHVVKYVPEWENNYQSQRDGFGGVTWNNQQKNARRFQSIIESKFL